ncbi:MAG: hypothetical protein AUG51_17320 [Acidobacteria bacterium 13_1_20CM_3_53_8]|nr:MAG: hypothetical protein AUG51_17320 [Acidobacteria bacterium 13_1_20CM_3_53_8]
MKRHLPRWLSVVVLLAACAAVSAQETLPELVRRVKPSVVSIITYDSRGDVLLSGSGFFTRPNQIITNLHVIAGAQRAEIRTLDGKGRTYPVTGILGVDEEGDLAVLRVSLPEGRARSLEITEDLPEEGENIFVIGNPLRLEGSVSNGIVSAVREVPGIGKILQITAPVSHGNSGSPVFNMKGQVVGVVTIRVTNGENINLALGSARVNQLRTTTPISFEQLAARTRLSSQAEAVAELWYRNGLDSLWLGNYENALANFENAVNKNPARAEAWIQVGYCRVKQGRNADAIKAFQQALRLNPNSVEAYNKLGDAYYYSSRFNEAIEAYKRATQLQPEQPEAYYNLGMTYLELGDHTAALEQSRILQPLDAKLYKKLMSEIQR